MNTGEEIYVVVVILALVAFAVTLGGMTWIERRWAHKNGR